MKLHAHLQIHSQAWTRTQIHLHIYQQKTARKFTRTFPSMKLHTILHLQIQVRIYGYTQRKQQIYILCDELANVLTRATIYEKSMRAQMSLQANVRVCFCCHFISCFVSVFFSLIIVITFFLHFPTLSGAYCRFFDIDDTP